MVARGLIKATMATGHGDFLYGQVMGDINILQGMNYINKYDESNIEEIKFSPDAVFEECEFQSINFNQHALKSVSFLNCKFVGCNLANQSLLNARFREVAFESCNLLGINWCLLKRLEMARFIDSKLNLSSFQGLKLKRIEIINCSVIDVDFSDADLAFGNFFGSNLSGANFEGSTLEEADFRASKNYLFDLRKTKIRGARFSFPEVISLITALGVEVDF